MRVLVHTAKQGIRLFKILSYIIKKICWLNCFILFYMNIQCDQKENKSEQALPIIGHVVAEFYGNKSSMHRRRQFVVPNATHTSWNGGITIVHFIIITW
jgi:hypothetical protein